MTEQTGLPEQAGLPEQQEIDSLEETLLQVSAHKRLIVSPSGSLLIVYSRRDLVRMHKAKSRAILRAEKQARDTMNTSQQAGPSHASGT